MLGILERKGLSFSDGREQLLPSGLQEPLDCPARDAHCLSGLLLLLPVEVAQAHGFQLVQPEFDDLQLRQRNPRRLEQIEAFDSTAVAKLLSARHSPPSIGSGDRETKLDVDALALSVHMHIMLAIQRTHKGGRQCLVTTERAPADRGQ